MSQSADEIEVMRALESTGRREAEAEHQTQCTLVEANPAGASR